MDNCSDLSRATIKEKKDQMRKLVGGKYLEMLHVSDTIDSMSREFATVSQSVQSLLSVWFELV